MRQCESNFRFLPAQEYQNHKQIKNERNHSTFRQKDNH